ncbi:MAG: DUF305 domain-containing protein [Vicinamibacterales bacterium]
MFLNSTYRLAACLVAAGLASAPVGAAAGQAGQQEPEQKPPIVQPGAPGEPNKVLDPDTASDLSKVQYSKADVEFMQGMIHHHSQAVEMTDLLMTRTNDPAMKLLGQRISISQQDEMHMMRTWLADRGQPVMSEHAMHMGPMLMPGMLTEAEMQQLAAAKGEEFDRLFLAGMIKHHGGALLMVDELFAKPAAAQEGEMYAFASDVVADQKMEMDRMAAMLKQKERAK